MEVLAIDNDLSLRLITEADDEKYITLIYENSERLEDSFEFLLSKVLSDYCWAYAEAVARFNQDDDYFNYLLYQDNSALPVGNISIQQIAEDKSSCNLAFFIDEEATQQGLGTRMLQKIVAFCFEQIGVSKIFMRVPLTNVAAKRTLEKVNFKQEALFQEEIKTFEGKYIDVEYYGLLREEYQLA
ncbi:hypothetical protein BKI52_03550 [marine bacterium AO1-C]|nr:hypothetical protein BKI52_03550 [marine bacterium AO1-C]